MSRVLMLAVLVAMAVGTVVCFMLGIWMDEDRWFETGAVLIVPTLFFGAVCGFVADR